MEETGLIFSSGKSRPTDTNFAQRFSRRLINHGLLAVSLVSTAKSAAETIVRAPQVEKGVGSYLGGFCGFAYLFLEMVRRPNQATQRGVRATQTGESDSGELFASFTYDAEAVGENNPHDETPVSLLPLCVIKSGNGISFHQPDARRRRHHMRR
jgi:hypothetical protein